MYRENPEKPRETPAVNSGIENLFHSIKAPLILTSYRGYENNIKYAFQVALQPAQ
jgi:hypothetical protein